MRRGMDLEHVIGLIYEAVSDSEIWNSALDAARQMFEADAMLLVYGNPSTSDLGVVGATGFNSHALSEYAGLRLTKDEMIRESMDGPAGIIVSSARSFRGKPFYRTSVYRHLLEPSDLAYITGAAAINKGEVHASMWMARSDRSPDFSVHDMHAFAGFSPHVARAMTAHHRIRQAELHAEMAVGAFDRVAVGVVLLDVRGVPVMVNREAERIACAKDGFVLFGDGMAAAMSNESKKLRELVRQVGGNDRRKGRAGGGAVRLTRPSGLPDYHVVVLLLPKKCQPSNGTGAVVVLFITDHQWTT